MLQSILSQADRRQVLRRAIYALFFAFVAASSLSGQIPAAANKYRAQLIREAHAARGLSAPVAMFGAQIHAESDWNASARSGAGAVGLSQFVPGTVAWMNKLYPAQLGGGNALDPNWALRALVFYDGWNYDRLGMYLEVAENRWAAALSAFNGGLGYTLKDAKIGNCNLWFGCGDQVSDGRSAASLAENRAYPQKIIHRLEPLYKRAGW